MMALTFILPTVLVLGLMLTLTAGLCAIVAPRLTLGVRIGVAVVFALLAILSILGFVSALEPGAGHLNWRIGYALMLLVSLAALARLIFASRGVLPSGSASGEEPTDV